MIHTLELLPYFLQLVSSIVVTGILVNSVFWFGADRVVGVQKYHVNVVSRLGGLGIAISICCGLLFISRNYSNESFLASLLMLAFTPIFIAGLIEDLTHLVKPRTRLWLACVSSIVALMVTQAFIIRTDLVPIDALLKIPGVSLVLTVLVVVGFLNSINIIDGFNGVASGSALIMALAIAMIAYIVDDYLIFRLSLIVSVSIIGFMIWNWPLGKIFLGDCGAYLLGIWIVELGILLQYRSSNISPMAPVLIGAYPMIETLFSIYRRKYLRAYPVSHPDALHLHTLIYRRLIRKKSLLGTSMKFLTPNSTVAIYIWLFVIFNSILAILFYDNTNALIFFVFFTFLVYIKFYSSIVNFKTPKFFYF